MASTDAFTRPVDQFSVSLVDRYSGHYSRIVTSTSKSDNADTNLNSSGGVPCNSSEAPSVQFGLFQYFFQANMIQYARKIARCTLLTTGSLATADGLVCFPRPRATVNDIVVIHRGHDSRLIGKVLGGKPSPKRH